jgi:glucose/arabinose dehydrogenase
MNCFATGRWIRLAVLWCAPLAAFGVPDSQRSTFAQKKEFVVPTGFEVRSFASEPMVVNPVAMTWDERGRLWTVERREYSLAPGRSGRRNQIRILEDRDADGKADKVHVFADGLKRATGIVLGRGGAYLAEGSRVLFLEDTYGDGRGGKRTIIPTPFDEREGEVLLRNLIWGPDAKLYMTYGISGRSSAGYQGGVARIDARTHRFEVFAEAAGFLGALDFDREGNAFVATAAGVFHVLPGGIYARRGSSEFAHAHEPMPFAENLRKADSSIHIYEGEQWPQKWRGEILHGTGNGIQAGRFDASPGSSRMTNWGASGSTFLASDAALTPVSIQTGPDGAVWMIASRDQNLQRPGRTPATVKGGSIWRVVWTGDNPDRPVASRPTREMNLAALSGVELAADLTHSNVWRRRMAQRLLTERGLTAFSPRRLHAGTPLHKLLEKDTNTHVRLVALWTLHGTGLIEEYGLDQTSEINEPAIRRWVARLTGERGYLLHDSFARLIKLAKDPDLTVRTAAAIAARQFVSGSLTTNTPPTIPINEVATGGILSALFLNSSNNVDPTFEFHFWMALEPIIVFDPNVIDYYHSDGAKKLWPFSANVLRRIMHRICEMRDEDVLMRSIVELGKVPADATLTLAAGLQGLLDGQQAHPAIPGDEAIAVVSRLAQSDDHAVAATARKLVAHWEEVRGRNAKSR